MQKISTIGLDVAKHCFRSTVSAMKGKSSFVGDFDAAR